MANDNKKDVNTVEIRPNEFETMAENNVKERGENAGFFHSLGRAIQGEKVDNQYLKSDGKTSSSE
jgi:hypothetical protein